MANEVALNDATMALLKAAQKDRPLDLAKMPPTMSGGLPRLSFKNNKIHLDNGTESVNVGGKTNECFLVIIDVARAMQRKFYGRAYSETDTSPPLCWSNSGINPDPMSARPQAAACVSCPKNARGSGVDGKSKACSQSLSVLAFVLDPKTTEPTLCTFNLGAGSYFGDVCDPDLRKDGFMNGNNLFSMFKKHSVGLDGLILSLTFDGGPGAHPSKLVFAIAQTTPKNLLAMSDEVDAETRTNAVTMRFRAPDADVNGAPIDAKAEDKKPAPAKAPATRVKSDVQDAEIVPDTDAEDGTAPAAVAARQAKRQLPTQAAPAQEPATQAEPANKFAALKSRLAAKTMAPADDSDV